MKNSGSSQGNWWNALKRGEISTALSSLVGASNQNAEQIAFLRSMLKEQRKASVMHIPLQELEVVVFDLETTGFEPLSGDEIISIGAIKVKGGQISENEPFYCLVKCEKAVPEHITQLTGITNEMVNRGLVLSVALQRFMAYAGTRVLIAHASGHDKAFLNAALWKTWRAKLTHRVLDTMLVAKRLEAKPRNYSLDELLELHRIPVTRRHHALEDAKMTAQLWIEYLDRMRERDVTTLGELYAYLSFQ